MSLFKKVDKVLASFGNTGAMERLHEDSVTEEKISVIGGDKIAESDEGTLLAGINELNGYLFMETVMLSKVKMKTFKGAMLHFIGEEDFKLASDTQEIESEFSNASNRFMTKISFDITEKEIEFIKNKKYNKVIFECKKVSLTLLRPESSAIQES